MGMSKQKMMISSRSRYAAQILFDLAQHQGETRSLREISQDRRLPRGYVARLMRPLQKAGLVEAIQGPAGGFRLLRQPAAINYLEVVDAMDGRFHICQDHSDPAACPWNGACGLVALWDRTTDRIRAIMAEITLEDALDEYADYCRKERLPSTATRKNSRKTTKIRKKAG